MATAEAEIRVEGVTAAYAESPVLEGVDIHIAAGEMVGIVGRNGSGKSTLLKVMGRLLKPRRGAVYLNGMDISSLPTQRVAQRMAVMPQAPVSPQQLTVRELIGYGRNPHISWLQRFGIHDQVVIQATMQSCRLEDCADRLLSTLSGGERQKAWIALALAQEPRIILLDEPVTFLDLGHQLEVMDLIAELNHVQGLTVVVVLHDLNLAARYCSRLIALEAGGVYADGPTENIIQEDVISDVFGLGAHIGSDPLTHKPVCYPYRLDANA